MNELKSILSQFKISTFKCVIEIVSVAYNFTRLVLHVSNNILCWGITLILSIFIARNKQICKANKLFRKYNKIGVIFIKMPFYVVNCFKIIDNKKHPYRIVNNKIPTALVVLMISLLFYFGELYSFVRIFRFATQYINELNDYRFMIGFFLEAYIIFSAFYIGAYCIKKAIVKDVKVV